MILCGAFDQTPVGTDTGLAIEQSRTIRGLFSVCRAESQIQAVLGLAARIDLPLFPNSAARIPRLGKSPGKSAQVL